MKSKFFTGMMIFLLALICLTGMKAEAKSVGDISPDDISREIID